MKLRSWLYRVARVLGDVGAVEHGTLGRRIVRRVAGRLTGRILRRLLR